MLKEKYRPSSKEILRTIKNLLFIIVGTALLAFSVSIFIVPFDLVTGGVSGIAIVLAKLLPFGGVLSEFSYRIYVDATGKMLSEESTVKYSQTEGWQTSRRIPVW